MDRSALPQEIEDLTCDVVPGPARLMGECTACVDESDADLWPAQEAVCVVVSHSPTGRRWEQEACALHVAMYVADESRYDAGVTVEIPTVPAAAA